MKLFVVITHDTDGSQVGAQLHTTKPLAELAAMRDINKELVEPAEAEHVLEQAWSDSGFALASVFGGDTNTWYLRELDLPYGEINHAYWTSQGVTP